VGAGRRTVPVLRHAAGRTRAALLRLFAARAMLAVFAHMGTSMCDPARMRHQVESVLAILDRLLTVLVQASHGRGDPRNGGATVGWLRPLAIRIVELECTVFHRARVDTQAVREACIELLSLLEPPDATGGDFAERYRQERATSVEASELHARACATCRALSPPCAFAADAVAGP